MPDNENDFGYDIIDEVPINSSRYLKLSVKDQEVRVRLVSEPKYKIRHWVLNETGKKTPINCEDESCPYCGKDVPAKEKLRKDALFGWVVIDREDSMVKVFTGPKSIALAIRDLAKDPDWGNPFNYDLKIRRTEEQGAGYYKVTPVPNGLPLTDEEKKAVEEAGYNLEEELEGGKRSEHVGDYGSDSGELSEEELENLPGNEEDLPF